MGATTPVEVGTRGTVASLVRKEIEYFRRLEFLDRHGSSGKPQEHTVAGQVAPRRSSSSWLSLSFTVVTTWRRRKRRRGSGGDGGGGRLLPRMCSVVEVADGDDRRRVNGIPGFSYRNLKDVGEKYEL
ncbi:hypothetical protein U1Q18_008926 [Sarracenia purpurea var. burkii]